jgi:hypothetical protein
MKPLCEARLFPDIESRQIPGFLHIDLLRRELEHEVQFVTLMWFDDLTSLTAFMGEDYTPEPCSVGREGRAFTL